MLVRPRSLSVPLLAFALSLSGACTPAPDAPPTRDAGTDAQETPDASPAACPTGPREGDRAPAFAGPAAPIEVVRDGLGVPHIYARSDEDVFFGSGYMQATDRLFQMDLMRRTARGTLAAVMGRDKLAQDQLLRLMGVARWGRESAARVRREDPESYRLVEAWVAGVNRRIAEVTAGAAPMPPGFRASEFDYAPEPWTVDDPYMVGRLLLFRNANQLDYDLLATILRRYIPDASELPIFRALGGAFIVPPDERPRGTMQARQGVRRGARRPRDFGPRLARMLATTEALRSGGSNNWAVAGRYTANGRPLLAGDPHQPIQSPSVFWAQHIDSATAGGSFDVAGFSFVGAPAVHLGHNRRVAWTATTVYPDMMDLWEVPSSNNAITLGGRAVPLARCVEAIAVRGASAVEYAVESAGEHGVLLPNGLTPLPVVAGTNRLLFNWTGFRATREAADFVALDRAPDVAAFDAAAARMEIAAFNFIAADARDIAYRSHVLLPDRGAPRTMPAPNAVLDGTDPRALWSGALLGADRQPHSRGGARGFLSSANNDPFGFTADGRIDDDPWYYGVWFDPGTRAARIESELTRLTRAGGVTLDQMKALQLDTHSVLADELLPVLQAAWARRTEDPALAPYRDDARLARLVEALGAWDRRMARDSAAAVVFEGWQHFFAREVLADDLDALFDAVLQREPVYVLKLLALTVNRRFPAADRYLQGGRDALALRALAATRDWLAARFGGAEPERYRWSQYHRTRVLPPFTPTGPFDGGALETDGAVGTVNVSQAVFFEGARPREYHESRAGAVYRMVVSFGEDGTPAAEVNFPRGNSGDPGSPWWGNADADWVAGTYRPLPFARAAVDASARERITINPSR